MRYSYQREAIKKIIQETNCHPTADWIFKQTKKIIDCWHDFEEENNKSIIVDKFCKIILIFHLITGKSYYYIYCATVITKIFS